ncbi:MAG TPA: T9SS type A sorting domain-containing protein, partial [Chitinophagaceae bacterium]|nr:T9SS type A sorting domain-containing protein [Chitinophagaceae bacterium]
DPCATIGSGEVEDYTARISGGTGLEAIAATDAKAKPLAISLTPNPVNSSSASFTYTIANTGAVMIKLMDMSGNMRQAISQGNKTAGTYTFTNSDVSKLPAGNYIAVLQQNGQLVARIPFIVSK